MGSVRRTLLFAVSMVVALAVLWVVVQVVSPQPYDGECVSKPGPSPGLYQGICP